MAADALPATPWHGSKWANVHGGHWPVETRIVTLDDTQNNGDFM